MTMTKEAQKKEGFGQDEGCLEEGQGEGDVGQEQGLGQEQELGQEQGLGQEGVELVVQLVSLAQELVQAKLRLETVSRCRPVHCACL